MKRLLTLAIPVVLSNLGNISMQMVDIWVVGRVNAPAIGAVGLSSSLFSWGMILGIGFLSSLDFLISRAVGRKNPIPNEAGVYAFQGLFLAVVFGIFCNTGLYVAASFYAEMGVHPDVVEGASGYLRILSFSMIPILVSTVIRAVLQAHGVARPIVWIFVVANIINLVMDLGMVLGYFGVPVIGVMGSAWATLTARLWMMGAFFYVLYRWDRKHNQGRMMMTPLKVVGSRVREIAELGVPASAQMGLEMGAFALATVLAGGLNPVALAAHEVVLNIASITFMVPLGVGSAGAVLVGQAVGAGDYVESRTRGWMALKLGIGFMACSGLTLLLIPHTLLGFFTADSEIFEAGKSILFCAALFQLFDGAQVVGAGVLRGLGDTRSSFVANLLGHWVIGLPLGYLLCFHSNYGLQGLWAGLASGLVAVALMLIFFWRRESNGLVSRDPDSLSKASLGRPLQGSMH